MGIGIPEMERVLERLSKRGVFRTKDLVRDGVSAGWMQLFFTDFTRCGRRGSRVWVAPGYEPTRYEVVQIRFPRAVFTGLSALWLLGVIDREPDTLWIALENKARLPRTLEPSTVVVRTRHLDDDVLLMRPPAQHTTLRIHNAPRALADLARRERRSTMKRCAVAGE